MGSIRFDYRMKTTISDVYMYNDDAEVAFREWLDSRIPSDITFTKDLTISPAISCEVGLDYLDESHDLFISVRVTTSDDRKDDYDYDDLLDNNVLLDEIENTVLPEYIDMFNHECGVVFPTANGEFKDYITFLDDRFYAAVYGDIKFDTVPVTATAYQIVDFEEYF